MTWETFDTAPKDREIDIWFKPEGMKGMRGSDIRWFESVGYWGRYEIRTDEIIEMKGIIYATHWMEIPEGPMNG